MFEQDMVQIWALHKAKFHIDGMTNTHPTYDNVLALQFFVNMLPVCIIWVWGLWMLENLFDEITDNMLYMGHHRWHYTYASSPKPKQPVNNI